MQVAPDWTWYRDAHGWHFMTPWWSGLAVLGVILVGAGIAAVVVTARSKRRRRP